MKISPGNFAVPGTRISRSSRLGVTGSVIASVLALLLSGSSPVLAGDQGNLNAGVHLPQSKAYGKSYGEWAATYWQWLLSFPDDQSPAHEQGEVVSGAQKQPKRMWILESGNFGDWYRSVEVPPGKALLFSITGVECDTLFFPGAAEADLRACVEAPFNDFVVLATAEVDGVPIENVDEYLVLSPLFEVTVPENGFGGTPPGTGQAMAKVGSSSCHRCPKGSTPSMFASKSLGFLSLRGTPPIMSRSDSFGM